MFKRAICGKDLLADLSILKDGLIPLKSCGIVYTAETIVYVNLLWYYKMGNIIYCFGKMNNSQQWIQERRLRGVYELLDGGNNKKVVVEADRMLKKHANFTCLKVLKALALIRMNKQSEAETILKAVAAETPTDDSTIQALSICYRELEDPIMLSKILEAACEKEKSEELLTHCFMAQVRTLEYQKMHKTALQLYKLYNKPTYYGWAVASLVIRFEHENPGPIEQTDNLSICYASRMMEKFRTQNKSKLDENMMELYMRVLVREANWEKVIEVLKEGGYPHSDWQNDDVHVLYCHALERTNKFDELNQFLRSTILKHNDDYALLKQFIDLVGTRDTKNAGEFLDYLIVNFPSRVVVLGYLYYCKVCVGGDIGKTQIANHLPLVAKFGLDKPSFFSDIMDYFTMVDRDTQYTVMKEIAVLPEPDGSNFDSVVKIIKDVNFEHIYREYIEEGDSELMRIRHANVCFGKYLICEKQKDSLRSDDNLRTKESDFHDHYVTIAAISLLMEYFESPNLREGCDFDAYLHSHPWTEIVKEDFHELKELKAGLQKSQENGQLESSKDLTASFEKLSVDESCKSSLNDREALLFFAICVLEYGLANSPHNHAIRILLCKTYCKFGAIAQAIKVLQGLDLKHVQWDTLGYLIIPQAISCGTYPDAMKILTTAEAMYTTYRRESMEHVIAAYKFGSFTKVSEFVQFRKQLIGSVQCNQVFTERRYLDVLMFGGSASDLRRLAENLVQEIAAKDIDGGVSSDNRDLAILEQFHVATDPSRIQEYSYTLDYLMLKYRFSQLIVVGSLVLMSCGEDYTMQLQHGIAALQFNMNMWMSHFGIEGYEEMNNNRFRIYDMWPPRIYRYFKLSIPKRQGEQIDLLRRMILGHYELDIQKLWKLMDEHLSTLLAVVQENYETMRKDKSLVKFDTYILDFHYTLEMFSFTRLLLFVAMTFHLQNTKSKGKQKEKTNQITKKSLLAFVEALLEKFKQFGECLNAFITEHKARPLPSLDNLKTSTRDLMNKSFLSVAFPSTFNVAQSNIRESHLNQLEEIRKVSVTCIDFIRNNMLNDLK